jgi:SAM-dependent methyltransferase
MNLLPDVLPKRLLDIGAGYGDFLRFMKRNGWETQGLEISRATYAKTRDKEILNIKCGTAKEILRLGFKSASVITLNNVLEHLRDPRGTLEMLRDNLLLPNGIILVIVPNDFNILQKILMKTVFKNTKKNLYYWVSPPDHLNYWSIKTMREFLIKCGFRILHTSVDFPMEIFPLMGEDYISNPEIGRIVHKKRFRFEKLLSESSMGKFKDGLFDALANAGIGRDMQIFAAKGRLTR